MKFDVEVACLVRSRREGVLRKLKSLMLCYLFRLGGAEAVTFTVFELLQRPVFSAVPLAQRSLLLTLALKALKLLFLSRLIRLFILY